MSEKILSSTHDAVPVKNTSREHEARNKFLIHQYIETEWMMNQTLVLLHGIMFPSPSITALLISTAFFSIINLYFVLEQKIYCNNPSCRMKPKLTKVHSMLTKIITVALVK